MAALFVSFKECLQHATAVQTHTKMFTYFKKNLIWIRNIFSLFIPAVRGQGRAYHASRQAAETSRCSCSQYYPITLWLTHGPILGLHRAT
jgi:hypothetical protein